MSPAEGPSIAVALSTFNGERYVDEQLQSLVRQTRRPDMIAVVDDASTDGTMDRLQSFARVAPLSLKLVQNPTRTGATGTFARAISLCEADIIFLCDQDDVWHDDKIERMAPILAGGGLAFCNADLVNEDLSPRGQTLWDSIGLTTADREAISSGRNVFETLLRRNLPWGASMAFHASLLEALFPFPENQGHDTWIFLVGAALGPARAVDAPLFKYRQHSRQMYGASAPSALSDRVTAATSSAQRHQQSLFAIWSSLLSRLGEVKGVPSARLAAVADRVRHLGVRAQLPPGRAARVRPVLRELTSGRYSRFSGGPRSALLDLVS
jgi:hypothetical protein